MPRERSKVTFYVTSPPIWRQSLRRTMDKWEELRENIERLCESPKDHLDTFLTLSYLIRLMAILECKERIDNILRHRTPSLRTDGESSPFEEGELQVSCK